MLQPLDRLSESMDSLPSLPPVLLRLTEAIRDPDTSARQWASILLQDPALTARLLRLVNSPYYGFPRRIATVTDALTLLGFRPVQHLLLTAAVVDLLHAEESLEFSAVSLWQHAVGTAVAAGLLGRAVGYRDHEALFVAGLLHDVGKLVEFQCLRPEFLQALALARAKDLPLHVAEEQVLGFGHAQAGRVLLEHWNLPLRLCEAVACHHQPDLAQEAQWEAAFLHVADGLAYGLGLGVGGQGTVGPVEIAAWEWVGLSTAGLAPLLAEIEAQHREVLAILFETLRSFPGLDDGLNGATWSRRGLRPAPGCPDRHSPESANH